MPTQFPPQFIVSGAIVCVTYCRILWLIGILSSKQGDEPLCMLAKTGVGWG
jgi:hypothetical protein